MDEVTQLKLTRCIGIERARKFREVTVVVVQYGTLAACVVGVLRGGVVVLLGCRWEGH